MLDDEGVMRKDTKREREREREKERNNLEMKNNINYWARENERNDKNDEKEKE